MSENRLLDIAKENEDLEELLTRERDYELLFQFSKMRSNVIRWFDFEPESSVLEVGGACGSITNYLCKQVQKVVCLERNSQLAEVNMYRNRGFRTLAFSQENLSDMEQESYDYIVMIHSLCFAKQYVKAGGMDDAYQQMLLEAKRLLKEGGSLLVAIPNKYGIKYLAGAVDELTGKRFSGMTDYNDATECRTFSKQKLEKMLRAAGFEKLSFYYPVPDHLFATDVYSDDYLPGCGDFYEKTPNYSTDQVVLFDEAMALNSICEDGLFPQFANSYLVVCQ